jgi:acetylornithine deacetylase
MEAPLWQEVCPTLVCGPSGGGLHAVDEWLDLRQLRAYAEALPRVLTAWAANADRDDAAV